MALLLCGVVQAQGPSTTDLAGSWQGLVDIGSGQRIVLKLGRQGSPDHPVWRGVEYSIDDKTYGYEGRNTTAMSFEGGQVRFTIAPIGVSYEGKLSPDGKTIAGQWTQNEQSHVLDLVRADGDAAWAIPQEDKAMARDADPDWEVVTVKPADPNGMNSGFQFHGRDVEVQRKPVETMLLVCCGMHKDQIVNLPDWARSEVWDAKGFADVPGQPSVKQFQGMIRKLLVERFGLKYHMEQRELPVYALTVAKNGEKMTPSAGDPNGIPNENDSGNGVEVTMHAENMKMSELAVMLDFFMNRPVVDQTGLTSRYDFQLKWTTDESKAPTDGSASPTIFTAMQEQMGLKLEPEKTMTDVMVIDNVQRPGAN
jgi:uncharacterized protein (TIGR03435 family)